MNICPLSCSLKLQVINFKFLYNKHCKLNYWNRKQFGRLIVFDFYSHFALHKIENAKWLSRRSKWHCILKKITLLVVCFFFFIFKKNLKEWREVISLLMKDMTKKLKGIWLTDECKEWICKLWTGGCRVTKIDDSSTPYNSKTNWFR